MPPRESQLTPTRWSLEDLYPSIDSAQLKDAWAEVEAKTTEFETCRTQLEGTITLETFLDIIHRYEELMRTAYQVVSYAYLCFYENTQDQNAQNFLARAEQFSANIQNSTLFFSLWWKNLAEEEAAKLMAGAGSYQYWLEEMRHFKPFTLTEPEEKIINIKDVTGSKALVTLYDTITNRYSFKLTVEGEQKELTRGELMVYPRLPDPELRKAAYQELYRVYGQDGSILGQMYQTLVRDWHNENIDLRHFSNPLAVRNLQNDIPDAVVETLLEVCQKNSTVFQDFFKLKARWLGMERLRRYDIYAPVSTSDKKYTYDKAVELVLDSFKGFDSQVAELATRIIEENHLDSEVRKGKQSGAFCYSVTPKLTPWVLVNYQGRPDDVATLAHELGHAIHSMLASHHTLFTWHASLPLAETASTFGEMMLTERLLQEETDEQVRRDLLFNQIDESYATIMRQAFFALFERQAHAMTDEGATVEQLSQAYFENLKLQFGDAVELSDEFRWEWVSIPHMYQYPFYVYAYAFGQLLVLSLYQQYKAEGEAFKPRYIKILAAGGSASPGKTLSEAGIDIQRAEFWQGGFDVIKSLVRQLEKLPIQS